MGWSSAMPRKGPEVERVAMLAHTCYLRDPRVRREAEALAEKGVEVHVIALAEESRTTGGPEPRRSGLNNVQIHRLPIRTRRRRRPRSPYEYTSVAVSRG